MFDVDGTPICTLDFTDFHEGWERGTLIQNLTGVDLKTYIKLFSEKGLKDTNQRISYVLTNSGNFVIAEPYCDYIPLGDIELRFSEIDKMKAFVELVKHSKVKFIPLKEGLTWIDIVYYKYLERLDRDLLFKRKQIDKLFCALLEYLDDNDTCNANIITNANKTVKSREYYSQNIPIPDEYFRMGWNIGTCDGAPIDSLELETEILKKSRLLNKKSLAFNHGKIDTFLTEEEEAFRYAMIGKNTPLKTRPYLMACLLSRVPDASKLLDDYFPSCISGLEIKRRIRKITKYKSQEDYPFERGYTNLAPSA